MSALEIFNDSALYKCSLNNNNNNNNNNSLTNYTKRYKKISWEPGTGS